MLGVIWEIAAVSAGVGVVAYSGGVQPRVALASRTGIGTPRSLPERAVPAILGMKGVGSTAGGV